jgi:hypothetical protein
MFHPASRVTRVRVGLAAAAAAALFFAGCSAPTEPIPVEATPSFGGMITIGGGAGVPGDSTSGPGVQSDGGMITVGGGGV